MKIIAKVLLFIFCLTLGFTSCTTSDSEAYFKEQANAYFLVFEELYESDIALNDGSKYMAVDLANVQLSDTTRLIELLQGFCDNHGYIFLQDNHEGLEEKGYIKDLYFEEGFLLSFNDKKLNQNTLITSAQKWRSGLGAIGADYTVKRKNNLRRITKTENSWIS